MTNRAGSRLFAVLIVAVMAGAAIAAASLGAASASGRSGGTAAPSLAITPEGACTTVTISSVGVSSDASIVAVSGTTATVQGSFDGNITDEFAGSVLNGAGYTVDPTSCGGDANAVALTAAGIEATDLSVVASGSAIGIYVNPDVATATITANTVSVTSTAGAPGLGIWAGNAVSATPDASTTTGAYTITDNTVTGPNGGAYTSPEAGSAGIQAAGASLDITGNTVSGFSDASSGDGSTGYDWYDGTQSVGLMVACAPGAATGACTVSGNTVTDNVIGIVNLLWNSAFSGVYQTGPITFSGNTISDSLGYGFFQEWTNDGLQSGPVTISDNTIDNSASGAIGLLLGGATFTVDNNVLIGTSDSGTDGASQPNWVGGSGPDSSLATESIAVVTGDEGTTAATFNGNAFVDTTLFYTYLGAAGSTFSAGESVTFTETGLPADSSWWVEMGGTAATVLGSYATAPNTIVFQFQNDSNPVAYSAGTSTDYYLVPASSASGSITVDGTALSEHLVFATGTFTVTYTETGLSARQLGKQGWTVTLNGVTESSHTAAIVFHGVEVGSFEFLVQGPNGELSSPGSGSQAVAGTTNVAISFAKGRTIALTFTEKGLGRTTPWALALDGAELTTTSRSLKFAGLDPGTYSYTVAYPTARQAITVTEGRSPVGTGASGNVIASRSAKLTVSFLYAYGVTFTESGLSSGTWSVTIKGNTQTASYSDSITFELGNGSYAYKIGTVAGYKSVGSPKRAAVIGASASVVVTFSPRGHAPVPVAAVAGLRATSVSRLVARGAVAELAAVLLALIGAAGALGYLARTSRRRSE